MNEGYGICPYNNNHHIILHRMPHHIVKCRKNYSGPPLKQCIFNATHLIRVELLKEHIANCPDGYNSDAERYMKLTNNCGYQRL